MHNESYLLRLSKNLKKKLYKRAKENDAKVAAYVRKLIEQDLEKSVSSESFSTSRNKKGVL